MNRTFDRIRSAKRKSFFKKYNHIFIEVNDDKAYLVIWDCTTDAEKCIAKQEVEMEGDIPRTVIDAVLSEKCFDGKSFLEVEKEITVTVIF